jgi:hypothetical protein
MNIKAVKNMITKEEKNKRNAIGTDDRELLTVRQFCVVYPWPTESGMRSYIYRANELGLSEAFLRVNRRILVIPQKFFSLIKEVTKHVNLGDLNEEPKRKKEKFYAKVGAEKPLV